MSERAAPVDDVDYEYGALALKADKPDLAIYAYREMLFCCGSSAEAMLRLGNCYEAKGQTERALIWYYKALEAKSGFADANFQAARCHFGRAEFAEAIHFVKKAIRADKQKEEYYVLLGDIYEKGKNKEKALKAYRKAVDIAPECSQCWLRLSGLHYNIGDYKSTDQVLQEGMELCLDAELPFLCAAAYFRMGDRRRGFDWLRTAISYEAMDSDFFFSWIPEMKKDRKVLRLLGKN